MFRVAVEDTKLMEVSISFSTISKKASRSLVDTPILSLVSISCANIIFLLSSRPAAWAHPSTPRKWSRKTKLLDGQWFNYFIDENFLDIKYFVNKLQYRPSHFLFFYVTLAYNDEQVQPNEGVLNDVWNDAKINLMITSLVWICSSLHAIVTPKKSFWSLGSLYASLILF